MCSIVNILYLLHCEVLELGQNDPLVFGESKILYIKLYKSKEVDVKYKDMNPFYK